MNVETGGTWRVFENDGVVHDIIVDFEIERYGNTWWTATSGMIGGGGRSPREAVMSRITSSKWRVREILAPGELSASERVDAMRTAAMNAAHTVPKSVLPSYVRDQARDDIRNLPNPADKS